MKFCPLSNGTRTYGGQVLCMEKDCVFTDEAGDCLVKQALQCYVAKERTAAAEKEATQKSFERLQNQLWSSTNISNLIERL